ncbi:AraC family transcriptional regulator (plasmid) [Agrobacterium leguminum]|uniref:AraC family transcriptional regulator n=1 Tax=Agrobacterium leguminum TaxID=2792015 RepID=UPI0030CA871B
MPQEISKGRIVFEGANVDELSVALSSKRALISVTSRESELPFRCEFARLDGITVGSCRYENALWASSKNAGETYRAILPVNGPAVFRLAGREIRTLANEGVIFDGAREFELITDRAREHIVLVFGKDMVHQRLAHILDAPISTDLDFHPQIDLRTSAGGALMHIAWSLNAGLMSEGEVLFKAPLALASLADAAIHLILNGFPHRMSADLTRFAHPVPRHVKYAIEYMRVNLSEPIHAADIAAAAGVSVRTLHHGFRQFKATTLMAYLQHLRLNAVHQDLQTAARGQTVSEIALKWGFVHGGRFAADYRQRFGQFPKETLLSSGVGQVQETNS